MTPLQLAYEIRPSRGFVETMKWWWNLQFHPTRCKSYPLLNRNGYVQILLQIRVADSDESISYKTSTPESPTLYIYTNIKLSLQYEPAFFGLYVYIFDVWRVLVLGLDLSSKEMFFLISKRKKLIWLVKLTFWLYECMFLGRACKLVVWSF